MSRGGFRHNVMFTLFILILLISPIYMQAILKTSAISYNKAPTILDTIKNKALYVAEKAADYVLSTRIPEAGGYKWPFKTPSEVIYDPGLIKGAAGIGLFLLKLYSYTGKPEYLDTAVKAAEWIISKARPEAGGYYYLIEDLRTSVVQWHEHEITELSIVNNYQVMYEKGGLSQVLAYIKSVYNYIDCAISIVVTNDEYISDIEPIVHVSSSDKLPFTPKISGDIERIGPGRYRIDVKVSGFEADVLFTLIKAKIGEILGASLLPYEKVILDTKPTVYLAGFRITDTDGTVHDVYLASPKLLPPLFDPFMVNGGYIVDVMSPVHLLVIDSMGRMVGAVYDEEGNYVMEINEIPGSFYTGPLGEGEFIYIPPSIENYTVKLYGVDNGDYTLRITAIHSDGTIDVDKYSGYIDTGQIVVYEYTTAQSENVEITSRGILDMIRSNDDIIIMTFLAIIVVLLIIYISKKHKT